jgi:hypothetical protein
VHYNLARLIKSVALHACTAVVRCVCSFPFSFCARAQVMIWQKA